MLDIDRQLPSVRAMGKPIRVAAVPIRMSQQTAIPAPLLVQAPAPRRGVEAHPPKSSCDLVLSHAHAAISSV
jgi:hypothetical protein